jgi:endonuclease III
VGCLTELFSALRKYYGPPKLPAARGPFELVLWENACYLLPDERRAEVFEGLRSKVGLTAKAIAGADSSILLELAKRGGMRPETRVFRWREIARITLGQFDGNLDQILQSPYKEAARALKQFPTIGDPGAQKILLMCGIAEGLPLESNGLRVLTRVGYGRVQKQYGATYRSVQETIAPELLASKPEALLVAHVLLREHGKTLCKTSQPSCESCPVAGKCAYTQQTSAVGGRMV